MIEFLTVTRNTGYTLILSMLVALVACDSSLKSSKKPDLAADRLISAGVFIMGSNKIDATGKQQEYGLVKPLFLDEHPERQV